MNEQFVMQELLAQGNAKVQISLSGADLREFGENLIKNTLKMVTAERKEVMLKVNEAAQKLSVDRSTLYRWEKTGYLKPVRMGGVPRYRLSDIEAIMNK